jgi:hypothetical protein
VVNEPERRAWHEAVEPVCPCFRARPDGATGCGAVGTSQPVTGMSRWLRSCHVRMRRERLAYHVPPLVKVPDFRVGPGQSSQSFQPIC